MRYIKLENNLGKIEKAKFPLPAKIFAGLLIFALLLVFFFFGGKSNFIFERGGLDKTSGRTNILLLGTAGEGQPGGDLSDTIIMASVDTTGKDVALVSVPRDLWVEELGAKVNAAYSKGEEKKKGEGLVFAKNIVEEIFGIPIHYSVKVDFEGFVQSIDLLGGIEVDVEKAFEDFKYPIAGREDDMCGLQITEVEVAGIRQTQVLDATGAAVLSPDPFTCRYEHIKFSSGLQHMDGVTALKFVRSRMGTNSAGSDFDRSQRQKQVILAMVKKVFDLRNLFSPAKVVEIVTTFGKNIDTDFRQKEFSQVPVILAQLNEFKFRNLALSSQGEQPLLYNPPVSDYGAWVLLPKNNDWRSLKETVGGFIEKPKTS